MIQKLNVLFIQIVSRILLHVFCIDSTPHKGIGLTWRAANNQVNFSQSMSIYNFIYSPKYFIYIAGGDFFINDGVK